MTVELKYLTLVTALTAITFVPYILNMIMTRGLMDAVGYPENPKPLAPWAERMRAAHANSVENLVVFAPLVLITHVLAINTGATAMACVIYFWARVAHLVAYTLRVPWVRTAGFMVGVGCQLTLAAAILV